DRAPGRRVAARALRAGSSGKFERRTASAGSSAATLRAAPRRALRRSGRARGRNPVVVGCEPAAFGGGSARFAAKGAPGCHGGMRDSGELVRALAHAGPDLG